MLHEGESHGAAASSSLCERGAHLPAAEPDLALPHTHQQGARARPVLGDDPRRPRPGPAVHRSHQRGARRADQRAQAGQARERDPRRAHCEERRAHATRTNQEEYLSSAGFIQCQTTIILIHSYIYIYIYNECYINLLLYIYKYKF